MIILVRPAPRLKVESATKCELEEYRKQAKADDRNTSIRSRIQFLHPSRAANEVSVADKNVQKTPSVTEKTQSDSYPCNPFKKENLKKSNHTENCKQENLKHEIEKVDKKGTAANLRNPYLVNSQNTLIKSLEKEAVIESIDKTQGKCAAIESAKVTSNKLTKDSNTKEHHKLASNPLNGSKEGGRNNTTETSETSSPPELPTCKEKDGRPDSGYETLVGNESRKSVLTEEYGEVDISQVVMRKNRRSVQSSGSTMNDIETEIPNGINEINNPCTESKATYEKYIDENGSKRKDFPMSNGDLQKVEICKSDEIYANTGNASADEIKKTEKSEETTEEDDVVVPMRRSKIVNKRSTLFDVHVPRVVVEAEEDENDLSNFSQKAIDGDLLTEEQENLIVNLTFEPIAELPFQMKDLQNEKCDFSEIRGMVTQRNSRITNLVSAGKNSVESLRKLIEQF
jgi:hypothetical protein